MGKYSDSVVDRFWSKVVPTGFCWLWTGAPDRDGYGTLRVAYKNLKSHRMAYEMLVGPIPDGLVIDHLCRVRNCVNPDHLEPVTSEENNKRAAANAKRYCKWGHIIDRQWGDQRSCSTCESIRNTKRREYKKLYMRKRRANVIN